MYDRITGENFQNTTAERSSDKVRLCNRIYEMKVHQRTRMYLVLFALYGLIYEKVTGGNFQNTTAERSPDRVRL